MAPSPELGQPKAPDKTPPSSTSTRDNCTQNESVLNNNSSGASIGINNNKNKMSIADGSSTNINHTISLNSSKAITAGAITTQGMTTSPSSTTANANVGPSSCSNATTTSANTPSSNNVERNTKNLWNLDDYQFKELLDEAMSYKNPKDIENKSETFKQLLQKVERKEEESAFSSIRALASKYSRGSSSHKHGGSLQDLVEAARNDSLLDSDYICGSRNRRHHHNSRPKKYSLVSSRQREGGSLPSNVNVSNCNLSVYEQPFLNEVNKRRGKNERTCSGTSCTSGTSGTSSTVSTCGHDSLSSGQIKDDLHTNSSGDTIIDINDSFLDDTQHLLAHDSLAQGISEHLDCDEGIELTAVNKFSRAIMNSSAQGKLESDSKHCVDDTVAFSSLERVKNVESAYIALDENYKACKSILGDKTSDIKPAIFPTTKTNTKHFDENGNSLNSPYSSSQSQAKAKKKKSQSERNTTTLNVKTVAGYRGEDTVEELLKFIENTDTKKNEKNISNKKKEKKKDKEKDKDVKKEVHKVKKSNSLEELRSCTKLDEDEKIENPVTLRNKSKKCSTNPNPTTSDGKENLKQQGHKRGERRSWGTEELTYLGESNAIEEVREKVKEKEKSKKSKENNEKHERSLEKSENSKKKKEDPSLNSSITDSIHSESAEFHVVTKKKKAKKRQQTDETRSTGGKNVSIKDSPGGNSSISNINTPQNKKYQASSNFTNDRDAYLNSLNANEPRRKSTSSVPPSEKSDSSDLDSVHSLPVESTSNRHHSSGNLITTTAAIASASATVVSASNASPQVQLQSYADIARTVNTNKYLNTITSPPIDKMDKWPTVSAYSTSSISGSSSSSGNSSFVLGGANEFPTKNSRKSLNKDFPDLVSDKSNNHNNDAGSSCSSTSSTSTIVKQISYSQSLSEDKHSNHGSGNVSHKSSSAAPTKLTDVIKSNEVTKQTLQKSKSMENESYYSNMDQYPALEKTVKRHANQNSMHDMKSNNSTSSTSQSTSLAATIKQQQQQQRSPSFSGIPISCVTTPAVGVTTCSVQTQQVNDVKSKVTSYSNMDGMNGIINPLVNTTSSSNSNLNTSNKKSKQQQQLQQHQLNAKVNFAENTQIVTSSAVEVNNVKNKQQQPQIVSVESFSNNSSSSTNINTNKKGKSDNPTQQQSQQQAIPAANNPHGRKNKKEKSNQNNSSCSNNINCNNNSQIDTTIVLTPLNSSNCSSNSKTSNRPAVIILNDINDSSLSIGNDFTFGDFNEEELRLFDSNQHHHSQQLEDSGHFNLNQSRHDILSTRGASAEPAFHPDETIHLSPHSDHGYSSSNNRSILSESVDGHLLCNKTDSEQTCMLSPSPTAIAANESSSNSKKPLSTQTPCTRNFSNEVAPNVATNLGTNQLITSTKPNPSCNSNNSNDISYDPCIIAVNNIPNVDSNRINSSNVFNNNNSSKLHQTQQLVNQILVTSSASSNISSNCNVNNISGMSSNNDSSSSLLDSKPTVNTIENVITTATTAAAAATNTALQQSAVVASTSSIIMDANSPAANTCIATSNNTIKSTNVNDTEVTSNWENQRKTCKKDVNIRFVAPSAAQELNAINLEKIVDFVGLAWEEVLHRVNRGAQFYSGQ